MSDTEDKSAYSRKVKDDDSEAERREFRAPSIRYPRAPPPSHLRMHNTRTESARQVEPPRHASQIRAPRHLVGKKAASDYRPDMGCSASAQSLAAQSTLSPFAEEFIPRDNTVFTPVSHLQHNFGAGDSPYYSPRPFKSSISDRLKVGRRGLGSSDTASNPVTKFIHIMDELQASSANFDSVRATVAEIAAIGANDSMMLDRLTKLAVTEAVKRPHFQYSCARLCALVDETAPKFHQMVIEQCGHLYLQYRKDTDKSQDSSFMVGLVTTCCELLYNFVRERKLPLKDLVEFMELIFQTMTDVINLNFSQENNIKAVCQALKLSGYYMHLACPKLMERLLKDLKHKMTDNKSKTSILIQSVLNLSSSGWGYVSDSGDSQESDPGASGDAECIGYSEYNSEITDIDDTVYYGPDGEVLTAEETSFLYCNLNDNSKAEVDDDTLWDPDNELGAEMQQAFKDFVEYSRKNPNN
ncbi:uncharacterized protein LOC113377232 [Ctenocephalides felis]|uniref:uncharacterized protein LOC113377142 n=1 Tax=Ctenocephalides felis TaxID=7515 RepID=UPI000E6E3247|nr:uncharacterized protein LOC113377142 [Ctenocephalides felis]XP_026473142.1 uncharacterized protein LOC113377142 [Ctenocephalides felis]XP_026473143.1 uncharacterized protein LOC113377142 [Ctenocephalides felis]XP_026473257.1 uncharacterized protein LOC113377232 [Ctenocephalides felis]XP_026473258.1 uncharacterized protein LOC113377232 [Ctenocephalides felis]XP_026473260.1 uncharacterized protein LOC113377232 [Ctenocephalides felis]